MERIIENLTGATRKAPGITLIGVSCALVLSSMASSPKAQGPGVYVALALASVMGLAGIWLTAKQLRSGAITFKIASETSGANLEHTIEQLGKNYDVLRQQATQGFVIAAIVMLIGVLVIFAGAAGQEFGFAKAGPLTTIAGVVTEAISGIGLYLFNKTFDRLNMTSDRLQDTWRVLEAFKKADALSDELKKVVMPTLIEQLAAPQATARRAVKKRSRRRIAQD